MEIYLVRHAEALDATEGLADELRHLTRRGRKDAAKLARRLKRHGVRPGLIISSPLIRAVQTAELLAAKIGRGTLVTATAALSPGAAVEALMAIIRQADRPKSILCVGHEPQLSQLAALLLGFEHIAPLTKGGCLALSVKPDRTGRHAAFNWYAPATGKLVTSPRKALVRPA